MGNSIDRQAPPLISGEVPADRRGVGLIPPLESDTLWLVYDGDCVLFRSPRRTRWLYPLLRATRNLSLRLAGKTQI